MLSFLSRLFGKPAPAAAITHEGYRIYPEPIRDGASFRIAARIEKDFADGTKVHQLIRADTRNSHADAESSSVIKARQVIDQLGDKLFG